MNGVGILETFTCVLSACSTKTLEPTGNLVHLGQSARGEFRANAGVPPPSGSATPSGCRRNVRHSPRTVFDSPSRKTSIGHMTGVSNGTACRASQTMPCSLQIPTASLTTMTPQSSSGGHTSGERNGDGVFSPRGHLRNRLPDSVVLPKVMTHYCLRRRQTLHGRHVAGHRSGCSTWSPSTNKSHVEAASSEFRRNQHMGYTGPIAGVRACRGPI